MTAPAPAQKTSQHYAEAILEFLFVGLALLILTAPVARILWEMAFR